MGQMHREGRSQEAIGAELDVPRQTVTDVISRIAGNRQVSRTGNTRPPPKVEPPNFTIRAGGQTDVELRRSIRMMRLPMRDGRAQ
jgi:hypothetical protein